MPSRYSKNKQGDAIEIHSDGLILNLNYWDCGCFDDYIKPVSLTECVDCSVDINEGSTSREGEVQELIYQTQLDNIKELISYIRETESAHFLEHVDSCGLTYDEALEDCEITHIYKTAILAERDLVTYLGEVNE
jgi:hypothetical protein